MRNNILIAATMIDLFNSFRHSHPNLTDLWINYLGLKKRHYTDADLDQGLLVLYNIAAGCKDLKREDIVRLLIYDVSL
jgi:hypothetical protein